MIFNACDSTADSVKLLWTNDNPNVSFSGIVQLDVSKYRMFYIVSKSSANSTNGIINTTVIVNDTSLLYQTCLVHTGSYVYSRTCKIVEKGIEFSTGTAYDMTSPTTGQGSANYALPLYIYGSNPIS